MVDSIFHSSGLYFGLDDDLRVYGILILSAQNVLLSLDLLHTITIFKKRKGFFLKNLKLEKIRNLIAIFGKALLNVSFLCIFQYCFYNFPIRNIPAKFFQRFFQEKSNLRGYTEIGMKKCKPRKCN